MLVPKLKLEMFLVQEVTQLEKKRQLLIVLAGALMADLAELGFTWGFSGRGLECICSWRQPQAA